MKPFQNYFLGLALALLPTLVSALPVGERDFMSASQLPQNGFEPFLVSSTARASFGMKKEADMYLFWLADTEENAVIRRRVIGSALDDNSLSRRVPKLIPTSWLYTPG
jgi:hypothetical protein